MKNRSRNLSLIAMIVCFIALVVFVFVPKLLGDFLLAHRYLAVGICLVAFISCAGAMVASSNKVIEENFVVDNEVVAEKPVAKEVVEEKTEEVVPVVEAPTPVVEENEDNEEESADIIRLDYSFKSKLILSTDEIKDFYRSIVSYATSYGVKVRKSWKKETIYKGRNVFALLTFKGKKLCVSFALDPKDYENSKYYFRDVSDVKKFEKTPLLMKITSARKVKYTKELLNLIFTNNGLENKNLEVAIEEIPMTSKEELIEQGLIKDPSKVNA